MDKVAEVYVPWHRSHIGSTPTSHSLSEAILLFNEEVKPPKNKGIQNLIRIKRLTTLLNTWTVDSALSLSETLLLFSLTK